jgi:peptidoglycan hydrolase CwlO-like protein
MDLHTLQRHVDAQFDKLNGKVDNLDAKLDSYAEAQAGHKKDIEHLQAFVRYAITASIAVAGFLALAFIDTLKG